MQNFNTICSGRIVAQGGFGKKGSLGRVLFEGSGKSPLVIYEGKFEYCAAFLKYLEKCKRWLDTPDDEKPPILPTFAEPVDARPGDIPYPSSRSSFDECLWVLARKIREQQPGHPIVDRCFQLQNGDQLVTDIMRMAETDPLLRAGLEHMGSKLVLAWEEIATQKPHLPLLGFMA